MKAIVVQGGGSYGAFTAGRICKQDKNYDIAVGSSTGALIAPFALLQDDDSLIQTYRGGISNKDIYTKFPFWNNGIPNLFMAAWAYHKGRKGLTDSKPLRQLIGKFYTELHHKTILNSDKELFVTVCELNARKNAAQYISAKEYPHNEFCDLIWASTLVPGLLEPLTISKVVDGVDTEIDLVDGGTVENVGLKKALELGASEIDVYLHETPNVGYKKTGSNWLHNIIRAIEIQRQQVVEDDLTINSLQATVNLNYLPYKLEGAGIMEFNPIVMTEWFNRGYTH